jgi:hypothetical protein
MRRLISFPLALVLSLAACTPLQNQPTDAPPPATPLPTSTSAPTSASGIMGQVRIGPTCPVVQADSPCPDRPFQATITVLDHNRNQVTQVQSDAQGKFRVAVPPGDYVLVPEQPDRVTRADEQTVTVVSGQFTQVTITYDSGIR